MTEQKTAYRTGFGVESEAGTARRKDVSYETD